MIKIKKSKVVLLAMMFAFSVFFCSSAFAIEYGQLGGRPTNPDSNVPNSDSWFMYKLNPGESKEDSLTVMNLFNQPMKTLVYAADSIRSAGGGFAVKQFSEPKNEVGSWVKFYPDPLPSFASKAFGDKKINEICSIDSDTLGKTYKLKEDEVSQLASWCQGTDHMEIDMSANQRLNVPFVITIPQSVDVGEHTGGIIIQKAAKDESQNSDGSKVLLVTRVGVRIYEVVPGDIVKKLDFSDLALSKNYSEFFLPWDAEKAQKFREYTLGSSISNAGNASTDLDEKISIRGILFAKSATQDISRQFQVLRGDKFDSNLSWKAPFFGYVSFQKEYTYKDSSGKDQVIASNMIKKWFIPWREIVAALLVLVILGAVYWVWFVYNKKKYGGVGWVAYKVKKTDTIANLAEKCKVDWKILVKTNRMKAPYLLTPGEDILIPGGVAGMAISETKGKKSKKEDVLEAESEPQEEKKTRAKKAEKGKEAVAADEPAAKAKNASKSRTKNIEIGMFAKKKKIEMEKTKAAYVKYLWIALGLLVVIAVVVVAFLLGRSGTQDASTKESLSSAVNNVPSSQGAQNQDPSSSGSSQSSAPAKIDAATLDVKVLNLGAAPGSAKKIKDFLVDKGYSKAAADNGQGDNVKGNTVYFKSDSLAEEASKIKDLLSTKKIEASVSKADGSSGQSGDIVVVLGE